MSWISLTCRLLVGMFQGVPGFCPGSRESSMGHLRGPQGYELLISVPQSKGQPRSQPQSKLSQHSRLQYAAESYARHKPRKPLQGGSHRSGHSRWGDHSSPHRLTDFSVRSQASHSHFPTAQMWRLIIQLESFIDSRSRTGWHPAQIPWLPLETCLVMFPRTLPLMVLLQPAHLPRVDGAGR